MARRASALDHTSRSESDGECGASSFDRLWHSACGVTAVRGPYLFAVGTGRLAREQVTHHRQAARHLREAYGRFAYAAVREAGTEVRPDPDARAAMLELGKEFAGDLYGAGLIFEGKGFAATIHRSFVTAVGLATKVRYPYRVFSDVASCGRWLEGQIPPQVGLSPGEAGRTLTSLRALACPTSLADSGVIRKPW